MRRQKKGCSVIVEVVAVGTELLIGQIVDTNSAHIGAQLAEAGFDAHYQVTVGDNIDRLGRTIRTALERADAVILTGGMGPTQDDLTREAICAVTGRSMARDEEHAARITERIIARGGAVSETVLRMADFPEGGRPLPNSQGLALGTALSHEGRWILAVPGVPREMRAMVDEEVMPLLRRAAGKAAVIKSRLLRTWGYGESQVAQLLDDLYDSANPSIAFLISDMEVGVRITAKAPDEASAQALLDPVEAEVRRRLGDAVFAADEISNLDVIAALLAERGWRAAVHEVGTAGRVAAGIAESGRGVFAGGIISADLPAATSVELARRACDAFAAEVGVGIGEAVVVEDSGQSASIFPVTVMTPEGERSRDVRVFGTGERARAYGVIAAHHLLRLGVAGHWWQP